MLTLMGNDVMLQFTHNINKVWIAQTMMRQKKKSGH